jgi:hypothetical protein
VPKQQSGWQAGKWRDCHKARGEWASAWQAGIVAEVPAPKVKVVDTTGAGDAFNAGYLAACLHGADIVRAVQDGIVVDDRIPRAWGRSTFVAERWPRPMRPG